MNFQVYVIRLIVSIGLCVLGFLVPFFVMLYLKLRYPEVEDLWLKANLISYQWFPISLFFWLFATYWLSDHRWRILGWVIFIVGLLLVIIGYALYRIYRQY
jgi:hypothetical protein